MRVPKVFRVVDRHGRAVAGARLAVVESTVPFPEVALIADAEGRVSLALRPGRFTFRAHAPDGQTGEVEVEGGSPGEVVVRVEPP